MPGPRVLLCSIDGMRPDALQMANTPVIDAVARDGAYTYGARTVMPCCTLPCHTSMLRGVDSARHGITSNTFQPLVRPVPSLLEAANAAGLRTGAFFNWEPLRDLFAPGALTVSFMFGSAFSPEDDDRVTEQAIDSMRRDRLDAVFFYLGWVDECGHKYGWMSSEYLEAIANADRCVGRLLEAWRALEPDRETALVLTSDHGGHERTHGVDCDEDMLIPWILEGSRIRKGVELRDAVRIQDTCVTLAHLLGLPRAREWEGRVVSEALMDGAV